MKFNKARESVLEPIEVGREDIRRLHNDIQGHMKALMDITADNQKTRTIKRHLSAGSQFNAYLKSFGETMHFYVMVIDDKTSVSKKFLDLILVDILSAVKLHSDNPVFDRFLHRLLHETDLRLKFVQHIRDSLFFNGRGTDNRIPRIMVPEGFLTDEGHECYELLDFICLALIMSSTTLVIKDQDRHYKEHKARQRFCNPKARVHLQANLKKFTKNMSQLIACFIESQLSSSRTLLYSPLSFEELNYVVTSLMYESLLARAIEVKEFTEDQTFTNRLPYKIRTRFLLTQIYSSSLSNVNRILTDKKNVFSGLRPTIWALEDIARRKKIGNQETNIRKINSTPLGHEEMLSLLEETTTKQVMLKMKENWHRYHPALVFNTDLKELVIKQEYSLHAYLKDTVKTIIDLYFRHTAVNFMQFCKAEDFEKVISRVLGLYIDHIFKLHYHIILESRLPSDTTEDIRNTVLNTIHQFLEDIAPIVTAGGQESEGYKDFLGEEKFLFHFDKDVYLKKDEEGWLKLFSATRVGNISILLKQIDECIAADIEVIEVQKAG